MSYPENSMPETPEPESKRENPHKRYLLERNLQRIKRVLDGELTPEEASEEITQRELELEERADHDGLTGLLNFQGFTNSLTEDLSIIQQYNIPAFLAFIDIDRLKEFNDTKGKMAGNKLIETYAKVLENEIAKRPHLPSLTGRFGGDEFVALVMGASTEDVWQLFEDVRREIPEAVKRVFQDPNLERTVSIGIVRVQYSDDAATLLDRADSKLNQAKGKRNQIIFEEYPLTISEHK
ncbi:GGDEF domain-containing protein [Candidatus Microgenomates bacterium]|nr:GGDEF domain-containing protein [Candidatus Microgenomates bacterium]